MKRHRATRPAAASSDDRPRRPTPSPAELAERQRRVEEHARRVAVELGRLPYVEPDTGQGLLFPSVL